MMAEREVIVSHTTIMRWVLHYEPECECRWARFSRPPGESWRMDETAVSVRGGRHYRFRAVDKSGKSIGSLLCNDRDKESAQAFFRSIVADERVPWPKKINIDSNKATLRGLQLLGKEDPRWRHVEVRTRRRCAASDSGIWVKTHGATKFGQMVDKNKRSRDEYRDRAQLVRSS
jgi:transposase-like protein